MKRYEIDGYEVKQIQLPEAGDKDPHPRLTFDGYGLHAGQPLTVWMPDGWHTVTLEMLWEVEGAGCWYINTPGLRDVCPIGLWCRV